MPFILSMWIDYSHKMNPLVLIEVKGLFEDTGGEHTKFLKNARKHDIAR